MSNPFDQFSADVKAALPGVPPQGPDGPPPQGVGGLDGFGSYPAPVPPSPARPQQPVMNAPPQHLHGQPNGYPPQNPNGYPPQNPGLGAHPHPPSQTNPFEIQSQQPPPQSLHRQDLGQLQNQAAVPINRQPSHQSQVEQNPFGVPQQQQMVPSGVPTNQYGMPSNQGNAVPPNQGNAGTQLGSLTQQPSSDLFVAPPGPPTGQPSDSWGSPSLQQPQQPPQPPHVDGMFGGALVPVQSGQPPAADPFSVFNSAPAVPSSNPPPPTGHAGGEFYGQQSPNPAMPPPASTGDVFAEMGFGGAGPGPQPTNSDGIFGAPVAATEPGQHKEGELPPGGEWYDARIFTPTLGVMFFKPQELTDSLFLNTDKEIVDALEERPVVAFIVEGSSARSAGVELGHVLLKVNGVDVRNPKEASRLIKEGPRPLPLLFYVPNTEVVVAEGEHMVKYDTRDTTAPNSAKDWKPKYVVIGGIIAQPWMMNMYRSKSEYDIAVIETQARRPVSVKVKQFSLQGARIQNDWQGPQMVKYKNKLHPWKYIVILPVARNPIKISSPNLSQLKPVHEGIRRVLLAQQRDRGSSANSGAPARGSGGPYSRGGSSRGGGSSRQDSYNRERASIQTRAPAAGPPTQDLFGGFDTPTQQPPPNHHGVPPHQPPPNYGAPPPTQQRTYGASLPEQGIGAPPPQYGAPPPQQVQQVPQQQNYPQNPYF